MADLTSTRAPNGATGVLVLASGDVLWGRGFGAEGAAVGEVCFNTAMTGYQEVLTDPSYAGQIVTFTFPHVGNVGTNDEDIETTNLAAAEPARAERLTAMVLGWHRSVPADNGPSLGAQAAKGGPKKKK